MPAMRRSLAGYATRRLGSGFANGAGDALLFDRGEKGFDDFGIELGAGAFLNLADRYLAGERRAPRTIGGHGGPGVQDRNDTRSERNFLSAQTFRIAATVEPLLMIKHHRRHRRQHGD